MRFRLFLLVLTCCLSAAGHAQSTETDLKIRLIGQPLYLRGAWGADTLYFDSTGQLARTSDHRSFMLCGVDVKKVHLEKDQLVLDGRRVGVEFKGTLSKRVALKANGVNPFHQKEEEVHIEILRPSDGDYSTALTAIFANGLADLTPLLPEYWQTYARKTFLPPNSSAAPITNFPRPVKKIGGSVKPPVLNHSIEPRYNEDAGKQGIRGMVLVNVILGKDGLPSHLSIVQPAGMGLDEDAIYAIQHYRFNPATENGSPVSVELDVKINFEMH